MNVPGLGEMTRDEGYDEPASKPIAIAVLGGRACTVVLEGYEDDPDLDDFHAAIKSLLSSDPAALDRASGHVYAYYLDMKRLWEREGEEVVKIASAQDVWRHVQFGDTLVMSRRSRDQRIYMSLECNCDWDQEHGLQLVFDASIEVVKVGAFDGHLTNADAFANPKLEGVVYVALK